MKDTLASLLPRFALLYQDAVRWVGFACPNGRVVTYDVESGELRIYESLDDFYEVVGHHELPSPVGIKLATEATNVRTVA